RRVPGIGVLVRPDAHAERLVPRPQPRPGHPRALHGGRGDASRRRRAGRGELRQGHRAGDRRGSGARAAAAGGGVSAVDPRRVCREVLASNSRSFDLASRLLPADCRDDAAAVYAWCRRVDDAIDLVPASEQPSALERMRQELDAVYAHAPQTDPVLQAFQQVVQARSIPQQYPSELLLGMEMDVRGQRYETLDDLLCYCYRVAGVVGLMMSHVMGVTD